MRHGLIPPSAAGPRKRHQALRRSYGSGYLRANCEKPGITPPGGRPVCGTATATSEVIGPRTGSAAPRARDCVAFEGALSPLWGCEPLSDVVPPTRETTPAFRMPACHADAVSVASGGRVCQRQSAASRYCMGRVEATGGAGSRADNPSLDTCECCCLDVSRICKGSRELAEIEQRAERAALAQTGVIPAVVDNERRPRSCTATCGKG
jgi:hypothetical protein